MPTSSSIAIATTFVNLAMWRMLYADDVGIVSWSPQGLFKMRWKSSSRFAKPRRCNRVGEEDRDHVHASTTA